MHVSSTTIEPHTNIKLCFSPGEKGQKWNWLDAAERREMCFFVVSLCSHTPLEKQCPTGLLLIMCRGIEGVLPQPSLPPEPSLQSSTQHWLKHKWGKYSGFAALQCDFNWNQKHVHVMCRWRSQIITWIKFTNTLGGLGCKIAMVQNAGISRLSLIVFVLLKHSLLSPLTAAGNPSYYILVPSSPQQKDK